jgi:AcrR family transcriptional regulator
MPRGDVRQQAILTATIELVGEIGYEAMTMDAVAGRARASKNTIYRRWNGKAELVRAALDAYLAARAPALPDTGALRGDLTALLAASRTRLTTEFTALMGGLVAAMRADEELREALWSHLVDDVGNIGPIIAQAIARGEVPAGTRADIVHEVIEALILRRMMLDEPIDEAFIAHAVDGVLLPLLTHSYPDQGDRP